MHSVDAYPSEKARFQHPSGVPSKATSFGRGFNRRLLTVKEQFERLRNRLVQLSEAIRLRYCRYAAVMTAAA